MPQSIHNPVFIGLLGGRNLSSFLKKNKYSSYFIICDSNTLKYCLSPLILSCTLLKEAEVIELEPGEESKSIEVVTSIWQTLTDFGADKKSLVINLGGGVVSDIGGFAASTYKRGIDFIHVPTTSLAMADASVGGKTGVNFSGIKNLIGTITQPKAVFIDPDFLKSLPNQHLINGFAEIIKIALILDKKFFKEISSLKINGSLIEPSIISKSVDLKSRVVKKDPNEQGLRKILNFGHTIGHAVESLFLNKSQPLLHGEAIVVGMAIESYLCYSLKRITKTELDQIINSLSLNFKFYKISPADLPAFFSFFDQDKKHINKAYMFALLKGIGKCEPAIKVNRAQIEKAITWYNNKIANAS
ncbi:MAG: 3-dehydroquinate synthase [Bacteroidia bacterium]